MSQNQVRSGYSPGGRVNKTFTRLLTRPLSDVEKPFLVSDLAALTAKSENKAFQRQRRLGLPGCLVDTMLTCAIALDSAYHCRVNKCYLHGCLVGEQVLIYPAAVYNKPFSSDRRVNSLGQLIMQMVMSVELNETL